MKTAVIADIHGNLPALNAVLADARGCGVERYILAGDYIFDLPWSNEVTETVRSLEGATAVRGNKEGYLPKFLSGDRSGWTFDQFGAMYQTIRELKPDNAEYLLSLPESAAVILPSGGTVYVTHWFPGFRDGGKLAAQSAQLYREASQNPSYDREAFLRHVHEFLRRDYVVNALSGVDAEVIVFGHTHLQWHGACGGRLVLNPGSCGQPLDGDNRAAYTLLTDAPDGITAEERRVCYDVEAVIAETERSEIYRQGRAWIELVLAALRSGLDTFGSFFELCERLANERGQSGIPYSNEVWNLAFETAQRGK
ncbi:MAG: metallophosphatase family protein [Oscillospiraceae bacterium]|nr:metallophosphatase family protein [Oscillospiraceae bacterium]